MFPLTESLPVRVTVYVAGDVAGSAGCDSWVELCLVEVGGVRRLAAAGAARARDHGEDAGHSIVADEASGGVVRDLAGVAGRIARAAGSHIRDEFDEF